ncbi:NAD-dependent protein deacetylase sir-2.1 [Patella vulgata]|uniref:NAD-dependent protein deacetylase sir-2.1 n=1 Tax=Patella vulgata TaxID=6465 RepID=UPI00217F4CDE|nr:NAD-dependent protein deacetylase sir-2.1 [Patella vulgata]
MADEEEVNSDRPQREARKCSMLSNILLKEERRAQLKEITSILKKAECDRSEKENIQLLVADDIVKLVQKRAKLQKTRKDRLLEIEDPPDILDVKCKQLAEEIKGSSNVVVYTGAGISTAASIPDYRGPNGIWTLLKKGQEPSAQDLSDAEPTFTHMSITKLSKEGHIKYIVSQNCDGLHLRSGFPRKCLSEVHGNMYIETCYNCQPKPNEYIRLFDVTEKTAMRRHATGRFCHDCNGQLKDTIVHFGEKGGMKSPYYWKKAAKAAQNADIILCLGTSLKVLKKYPCLWAMDKRPSKRPKLYIVNLQWTPKDEGALSKINGRCDDVMERVMKYLDMTVSPYRKQDDPIFRHATLLKSDEIDTTEKKILQIPVNAIKKLERKSNIGTARPKIKSLNKHTTIQKILNSPFKISNSVPEDETDNDGKDAQEHNYSGTRKASDISSEVRERLSHMLRKNAHISTPTVFHNPMMQQLPLPIFPFMPGTIFGPNFIPYPPLMVANHHLESGLPSTSLPDKTSMQNMFHNSNILTQQDWCQLLRQTSLHHLNFANNTGFTSIMEQHQQQRPFCIKQEIVPKDLKAPCHVPINVSLDHCYYKAFNGVKSPPAKLRRVSPVKGNIKNKVVESVSKTNKIRHKIKQEIQKNSNNKSEIIKSEDVNTDNIFSDINKTAVKSETNNSMSPSKKEDDSSKPSTVDKRRRSSSSIPGWFGKGLSIKRKRKF